MSGPVNPSVEEPLDVSDLPEHCEVELIDGRRSSVGAVDVNRLVPTRAKRMVGAWCFVDHMLPTQLTAEGGLDIGPHPHIGLQTVTWLIDGAVLHRDSLGYEQLIRPGQLNLMTAGAGVSHSEETRGVYAGELEGIQLWVAQPSATRNDPAAFEHHEDLPQFDLDHGTGTVIVGSFTGTRSPARTDTDHVGVDLVVGDGRSVLSLDSGYEYALVPISGTMSVCGTHLEPGRLGYLGIGRDELELDSDVGARALLIGGVPFEEKLVMWWNYVARDRDEVTRANREWTAGHDRFGTVASDLDRVTVDDPPWA